MYRPKNDEDSAHYNKHIGILVPVYSFGNKSYMYCRNEQFAVPSSSNYILT